MRALHRFCLVAMFVAYSAHAGEEEAVLLKPRWQEGERFTVTLKVERTLVTEASKHLPASRIQESRTIGYEERTVSVARGRPTQATRRFHTHNLRTQSDLGVRGPHGGPDETEEEHVLLGKTIKIGWAEDAFVPVSAPVEQSLGSAVHGVDWQGILPGIGVRAGASWTAEGRGVWSLQGVFDSNVSWLMGLTCEVTKVRGTSGERIVRIAFRTGQRGALSEGWAEYSSKVGRVVRAYVKTSATTDSGLVLGASRATTEVHYERKPSAEAKSNEPDGG